VSTPAERIRKYLNMAAQTRVEELPLAESIHEDHPSCATANLEAWGNKTAARSKNEQKTRSFGQ
jgi:hypothetical protein